MSVTSFSPPTAPKNTSQTGRGKKKNQNPRNKTQKGHEMLCGLSVLGMTWILVPVQVTKAPKTHNSLHKIPCHCKSSGLFLSLRNNTINATAVNRGRLPQGYARSGLETQGSVSEVLMAGWAANVNGESLKFISCCHRKIRTNRRHKSEREKSERRKFRSRGLKEKSAVVLLQNISWI